jgi:hypothetical protein
MLFIFSTPEMIRNLWQLKTAVFLHQHLIRAVPLVLISIQNLKKFGDIDLKNSVNRFAPLFEFN